jgi:hypothetical protein
MTTEDWEHDDWVQQFNTVLNDALGVDDDEPFRDDSDEMAISDIAAKLHNGKITLAEAIRRAMEWMAGRSGFKIHRDPESWELEMQVGGFIDVTEGTKLNLLTAGEVGLADVMKQINAAPSLLTMGPGDVADIDHPPCIGVVSKSWADLGKLSPPEAANLHWAVTTALKAKLSE